MTFQQIKLIDKTLSGELTGTNIMPEEAQVQAIGRSNTNCVQTAQANPLSSDSYNLHPGSTLSTRGVPKQVQKVDCLGNKLWLLDGKPKMTTIYVEDPASASVQYQQTPKLQLPAFLEDRHSLNLLNQ